MKSIEIIFKFYLPVSILNSLVVFRRIGFWLSLDLSRVLDLTLSQGLTNSDTCDTERFTVVVFWFWFDLSSDDSAELDSLTSELFLLTTALELGGAAYVVILKLSKVELFSIWSPVETGVSMSPVIFVDMSVESCDMTADLGVCSSRFSTIGDDSGVVFGVSGGSLKVGGAGSLYSQSMGGSSGQVFRGDGKASGSISAASSRILPGEETTRPNDL